MPPAAGLADPRPPGAAARSKARGGGPAAGSSKPNIKELKALRDSAIDDDQEETTTESDSDEDDSAFEMDGQELWTQTYCITCDCLIEPGEGIAKQSSSAEPPSSPTTHTTLKGRSGTIKARASSTADNAKPTNTIEAKSPSTTKTAPSPLKRTHSAGRLHAKAGAGPLGPHKRTGSAGSRLNALSELRPTTKLHDDKGKGKEKTSVRDSHRPNSHKSPATSRPGSAASHRSHSNSSGPSSFKSTDAIAGANANSADGQNRNRKRGFLGGLGLTPAALKQQEEELAAKRKAPTPLYCSERCRLIDERRSSGLGELTKYLSQPLQPPTSAAWAPTAPPMWQRSISNSSMPMPAMANTPESECFCAKCMDKYADGSSASGVGVPSGASDTATESSNGYVYGRNAGHKPRTASGRLITPLNLHAPGGANESYFPQFAPAQGMSSTGQHSPRVHALDATSPIPPRTSSAASGGRASASGTEGSVLSSESGSSLWEPRLKPRSNSGVRNGGVARSSQAAEYSGSGMASGMSTNTATPAITPRQSMIVPSSGRAMHRLSIPFFAPTHEMEEEGHLLSDGRRATSPASTLSQRPGSSAKRSSLLLATSPLKLLDKASQHHAAPSVDLFSDHVGSPTTRGSLLSRSLASEHTLMGASGITLTNQYAPGTSTPMYEATPSFRQSSHDQAPSSKSSALSQSLSDPSAVHCNPINTDSDDGLSMAVGSLRLAQSRASGLLTSHRRSTDVSEPRPSDFRRLSLFGVTGAPGRRNSNALSVSSSASGSTSSGWLRSLSSAWHNWRSTASPVAMNADSDVFHSTDDSDEWPSRGSDHRTSRRQSTASRSSSHHRLPYAQKRALSARELENDYLRPAEMSRQPSSSDDRSAGVTPTQSLVAKPTIRRGHVPAYVREIGQGGIPGEHSPEAAKTEEGAPGDAAQRLERARVDSFTRLGDAEQQRKLNKRRSRDISVLPPLLAPISRSGSSTNLYAQMPRSARAYSTGRAWTAANTPQMYVGSAGSSHLLFSSPTTVRSPHHSSFALAQDAARATAQTPSRPKSAAGYHTLYGSAGTSPRAKGLGWGLMTSIASPPASNAETDFPAYPQHHGGRQSISYGHAAAMASRQVAQHAHKGHAHHHSAHGYGHAHHHHHQHHHGQHIHGHEHGHGHLQQSGSGSGVQTSTGHFMNLGAPPSSNTHVEHGRHVTMPVTSLHRSATPSVPEDGGEMSTQDLTGEFVSRPNSAMGQGKRHHRTGLMAPPRSRSSLGVHRLQRLSSAEPMAVEEATEAVEEPHRNWSYDQLDGLKTYPILQLPDRETHDVYDPNWNGMVNQLGSKQQREAEAEGKRKEEAKGSTREEKREDKKGVQVGFEPGHRKKLFYFDA